MAWKVDTEEDRGVLVGASAVCCTEARSGGSSRLARPGIKKQRAQDWAHAFRLAKPGRDEAEEHYFILWQKSPFPAFLLGRLFLLLCVFPLGGLF